MDLNAFTRQLIDIPSTSGNEAALGDFLAAYLSGEGYTVELQKVAGERANLIARACDEPRLMLSTHLDTVPPHIASSEDARYIYGRGACDAKGIIAAQVFAAARLRASGTREVGLLFTVDEEEASAGARAANEHPLASRNQYLINGEPTGNLLAVGSKGSLRVRVRTKGRAAHSAYPEQGELAILKLLDLLEELRAQEWPGDPFFGETTCNIGTINGGTRSNIIPAEAEATLHFRLTTPSGIFREALEEVVAERCELEYLSVSEPVRMLAVEGFKQSVVRFTTDIPYLDNWGVPLLIGPGSILDAHTAHERINKRELERAVGLYVRLARALLGVDPTRRANRRRTAAAKEKSDEC